VSNPSKWIVDGKHKLSNNFSFWLLKHSAYSNHADYMKNLHQIGPFDTVEDFWAIYSYLKRPSELGAAYTCHCFRDNIVPLWEDPANAKGGRWVVKLKRGTGSKAYENALLAMVGDEYNLGDELCGVVLSVKKYGDESLAFWNRHAQSRESITRLRDAIKRILGVGSNALEYKPHDLAIQKALDKGVDLKEVEDGDTIVEGDEQAQ
jgi:translation initiation factor 4E